MEMLRRTGRAILLISLSIVVATVFRVALGLWLVGVPLMFELPGSAVALSPW